MLQGTHDVRAIPLTPSTIVIAAASVQGAGYRVQGDAASPLLPARGEAGYRVQGDTASPLLPAMVAIGFAPTAFETLAAPEDALVSK